MKFYCTYCAEPIESSDELVSSNSVCPSCGNEINVPPIQPDHEQHPDPYAPEPPNDVKAPKTPQNHSLPMTNTEADISLGGKMLSFVGSGILILVVVFFSRQCGGFIGKQAAESELAKGATTQSGQSSTEDTLVELDLVGLMIRLPGRPNERIIPMPDSIKTTLKSKDSYIYQDGTQTVSVARDVFIEEFDFASRCDIVFEQLKSVDSDAGQRKYSIDGASGRWFTFDAGNGTYCNLLVFNRGNILWQVQVLDIASRSESTKTLTETIFSSIRINN